MYKSCILVFLLVFSALLLSGCLSSVWTGATLIYDRHNVYKQVGDFQLAASASRALYRDKVFKCSDCFIDLAIFNGDILLAGHVPSTSLREEAQKRMMSLSGYRRLFNQLSVRQKQSSLLQDSWITAKIRSQIIADAAINPKKFKIVTVDRVVYLLGDVIPSQAARVILIARKTAGVKRVVKLLKYYNLSDRPSA
ncbi:BON domain-containing protein [Legionella nagasakiensis]|uniref:BON domain-containing protein n=1 Tax=Legionella nagasakiensis TaxID=535290 RepID=UPI001054DBD2|nr:BON domain-containing protein [Legionella nagasakiensis]